MQRLDIYLPPASSDLPLPVFINIHGGGWTHGYKELLGLNAPAIVSFPAIYVSVGYRLAPDSRHPAQVEDCARAVAWVFQNISHFGGNPQRIHLGGHSAGGHIAALLVLQTAYLARHHLPHGLVKSCFPYSGIYDLRKMGIYGEAEEINPAAAFLANLADAPEASPIVSASVSKTPFYVSWGENDFGLMKAQAPAFITALERSGVRVEGLQVAGLDHFWIHIDQQRIDNPWTTALKSWMLADPVTLQTLD